MKIGKNPAAILGTALFSLSAYSAEFNYSYLELTGASSELETERKTSAGKQNNDIESDTYSLLWSHDFGADYWEFSQPLFAQLGLGLSRIDDIGSRSFDRGDVDINTVSGLIGFHDKPMQQLSYYAGVGYTGRFFSADLPNEANERFFERQKLHSYRLGGGVRYKPLTYLELRGGAFYTGFDTSDFAGDVDDDLVVDVGVVFHPNRVFALSVDYRTGVEGTFDDLSLSLRYKL